MRRKSRQLTFDILEDRCMPSYLLPDYGLSTIRGRTNQGDHITSASFGTGGGVVSIDPYDPQEVSLSTALPPTLPFYALNTLFPNYSFTNSNQTLVDGSLVVKGYDAYSWEGANNNWEIGADINVAYNQLPGDPAVGLKWIQLTEKQRGREPLLLT